LEEFNKITSREYIANFSTRICANIINEIFKLYKNKYFWIFLFFVYLTYQIILGLLNYELDYTLQSNPNPNPNSTYSNVNQQEELR